MAKVKIRAISRSEPLARFWLMSALEAGRDALFDAVRPLVTAIEQERGIRLDYWGRRCVAGTVEGRREALRVFSRMSLPPDSEGPLLEAVNTVFDNFEEQFSLSLRIAQGNYFGASDTGAQYASESRLRSRVQRSATGTDE